MTTHALERLEWGRVLAQMAGYARLEETRVALQDSTPTADAAWLEERHRLTRAADHPALRALDLGGAADLGAIVDRAQKGARLDPEELLAVGRTIQRGHAMLEALAKAGDSLLEAHFGQYGAPLPLLREIGQTVDDEGAILDSASPELRDIRRRMAAVQREIDAVFARIVHAPEWAPYLQEALVTIRGGRRVVPVRATHRHQVPGLVHDQSASGQTVFVEPLSVVERQNALAGLTADEAREIDRILRRLSGRVAELGDTLQGLSRSIIRLEAVLAVLRWADEAGAVLPELGGDVLDLNAARHPLLEAPVPLSLRVGGSHRILVITGPNTGGKTVALKCVGVTVALALSGFPVPAEAARVPLYRQLFADIGDEQSLEQSLSTFSGHVAQLVPMVEAAGPDTLLLVDEIGAGTDPDEGAALAVALLEHFRERGATVVATTHFARVKLLAYRDPLVANAHVEFDPETLKPTYRLVMGQPGSSQALATARRLGLNAAVLERARDLLGEGPLQVEEVLRRVNALERTLNAEKADVDRQAAALEEARKTLALEHKAAEERRRAEWERHRRAWQETLRQIRAEAEEVLAAARAAGKAEREQALLALREGLRRWEAEQPPPWAEDREAEAGAASVITRGMWVVGGPLGEPGQVTDVQGDTAVVQAGSMRIRVPVGQLRAAAGGPAAPPRSSRTAWSSAPALSMECDLRGLTVLDAVDTLDRYLDAALRAGLPMVRVIHGRGTGAVRRAVHEYLRDHPAVQRFRLGEAGEGGDGATVVYLSADL
jgi:DNA mismatch repair protein MutS2